MQRGQARQVISVLLQRLVETTRIGATGGASSSPTKSERDSANTKPYKHTQTLTLRKAGGIVRKISLMVRMGSNPSGSRPNFFGRQKFAFDEVGKGDSAFCRIALLGFAIRINTLVNINEGKNQRD